MVTERKILSIYSYSQEIVQNVLQSPLYYIGQKLTPGLKAQL